MLNSFLLLEGGGFIALVGGGGLLLEEGDGGYYSAFQGDAFQSNAFQILQQGEEPPVVGYADGHFKEYRKQLKRIAKAADKRLYKEVKEEVDLIAESPDEEVADVTREIQTQIDFGAIANLQSAVMHEHLVALLEKLDNLINRAIMQEAEDEHILMMAIL